MDEQPKRKRGGRKAGVKNKATKAVKEAICEAFEKLGGVPALVKFAKKYPTVFYSQIWAKLLPTDVKVTGNVSTSLVVTEILVTTREEAKPFVVSNDKQPEHISALPEATGLPPVQ